MENGESKEKLIFLSKIFLFYFSIFEKKAPEVLCNFLLWHFVLFFDDSLDKKIYQAALYWELDTRHAFWINFFYYSTDWNDDETTAAVVDSSMLT